MNSEPTRHDALAQLKILDTPPSESFDRITRMASRLFDLPIAAVSLTDHDRQWFKSRVGVDHWSIPRDKAPCAAVAETTRILVIPDLLLDACYNDSVLAKAGVRFYAGAPLVTRDGYGLGAMCVLGTEPRQASSEECAALSDLASMVMSQIELQHAFGRIEPVSGLPNRHQLLDDLQDSARDAPGALRSLVIAEVAETSRLREAVRVLGPVAIDDLVRATSRGLTRILGPSVRIYQVGATQFAWMTSHADETVQTQSLKKLSRTIESCIRSRRLPTLADPVVGLAPFRLGEVTADTILRIAHSAAQDARNSDDRVSIYSEAADDRHTRRFRLLSDFREALLAPDQLSLFYQPRVSLGTSACVAAEALLRWTHPALGNVPPGEFIPAVEQTDLARPLTEWVIETAIAQTLAWREKGIVVPISVNVSATNLEETDFATRLIERLAAAGLPSDAIEIEVTESAVIRDGSTVGRHLQQIRDARIKVAIDDFGTGYSSLSYLQNLPADIVKIDQSFIRDLSSNARGLTMVRSMIGMARSLGFHVVAEGIEDEGAYALLGSASCDEAQGYWISRPVPAPAFATWFTDRRDAASLQS